MLLNFSAELYGILFRMEVLVGFLPDENEEDYSTVQGIKKHECSWKATVSETSELGSLENLTAQTTV